MVTDERKFWFPARRYGWGWGLPCRWQGWVFMVVWLTALVGGALRIRPDQHVVAFIVFELSMIAVLLVVCLLKGEKPGWRWGGK